jgi:hypothetical protein
MRHKCNIWGLYLERKQNFFGGRFRKGIVDEVILERCYKCWSLPSEQARISHSTTHFGNNK